MHLSVLNVKKWTDSGQEKNVVVADLSVFFTVSSKYLNFYFSITVFLVVFCWFGKYADVCSMNRGTRHREVF